MTRERADELTRLFGTAPFIADLGIELISAADGACATSLDLLPRHLQQDGYVHAGVQATIADHTAGGAAATLARPGTKVLTAELTIHLLRPARGERLECVARVLRPGRTLTVVEAEVFCLAGAERALVSKATAAIANVAKEPPASG